MGAGCRPTNGTGRSPTRRGTSGSGRSPGPGPTGKPVTIQLAVTKEGMPASTRSGTDFQPPAGDATQVAETVTLGTGSLGERHRGRSRRQAAGGSLDRAGWVVREPQPVHQDRRRRPVHRPRPTRRGWSPSAFSYGKLMAGGKYLADRGADPVTIKLRPDARCRPAQGPGRCREGGPGQPEALALGTPAPEWESGAWSDGRSRTLADYRGKVVFLNFWGIWCGPCVDELCPRSKNSAPSTSRSVSFSSRSTLPARREKSVRKVLEMKKASLVFAFDRDRERRDGIRPERRDRRAIRRGRLPHNVIIDREGKSPSAPRPRQHPAMQAGRQGDGPRPEDDQRGAGFSADRAAISIR